jgi:Ca-activated chloride channel homolog
MLRYFPFALMGLIGLSGYAISQDEPSSLPIDLDHTPGSVEVRADLDHGHLLAGQEHEVLSRIALTGIKAPPPKEQLPLSLTLIIDTSGSMSGEKIRNARESAMAALTQLRPGDRFSVVAFSSGARVLVPRTTMGSSQMSQIRDAVLSLSASGGTNMSHALSVGGEQAQSLYSSQHTNRILLLSDGKPDSQHGLTDQVRALAQQGILTTTLGIGRGYNEDLMAELADAGLANYYFVLNPSDMQRIFQTEIASLASVVAKEAIVVLRPKNGVRVDHIFGYPYTRDGQNVVVPVGDVYSQKKIDVLARLKAPGLQGEVNLVDVQVTYHDVLAQTAKVASRSLGAAFTSDQNKVTASANMFVLEKAQKVQTADALKEASVYFGRGDSKKANAVIAKQQAALRSESARYGEDEGIQKNSASLMDELKGMVLEAAAPAADMNVMQKSYKSKARKMKR